MLTYNQKKSKLRHYNSYLIAREEYKEKYMELYTEATKITPHINETGGGSGSFNNDKLSDQCAKLVEISNKIEWYDSQIKKMDKALNSLPFYHRKLIKIIDIDNVSVYRASRMLRRSYNSVKASHEKALENIKL